MYIDNKIAALQALVLDLTERVDALEESQNVQDGAIDDLGGAVSELMEG